MLIDSAPRIELKPPNRPTIVAAPANSANAPPIALKPRPICSQLIEPSFLRFSEISSNVLDMIRIEVAPATEFNPENFCKITAAPTSSDRAPPIEVRPRWIVFQLIEPNFLRLVDISSSVDASINIEVAPNTEPKPENCCRITAAPTNSDSAPPIAVRPR